MDYSHARSYLDCSHFYTRSFKSTRFDPDNAACFCKRCHDYMGKHPAEHDAWFLKRLGQKRFDLLTLRANTPQKVDEKLIEMWLKKEIKKLEDAEPMIYGAR